MGRPKDKEKVRWAFRVGSALYDPDRPKSKRSYRVLAHKERDERVKLVGTTTGHYYRVMIYFKGHEVCAVEMDKTLVEENLALLSEPEEEKTGWDT